MKKLLIIVSLVSVSVAKAEEPNYFTVQNLKEMCDVSNTRSNYQYCIGYMNGVYNGYETMNVLHEKPSQICIPSPGMTNGQAVDIFLKWARENPKNYMFPASAGYILSIMDAFPCAAKSQ